MFKSLLYLLYWGWGDVNGPKVGKTLKTTSNWPTFLLFVKISVTKSNNLTTNALLFQEVLSLL